MEDKKILVFYVGIGNMENSDISEYINHVKNSYFNESLITGLNAEVFLIPVRDNSSRLECINPKYITDPELIKSHEEMMKKFNDALKVE